MALVSYAPVYSSYSGETSGDPAVIGQIGNTPLLRLARIEERFAFALGVELYAKAEYANPGGSVKDRAALCMIREGERQGALKQGKTILDASSGNTGIAYAMIGTALGYRVEICLPESAGSERKRLLKLLGAKIVSTPAADGTDGAILEARRRHQADPDRYFYPDQYSNPANWQAHYYGTAPEIWNQTDGRVTHFVAVVGTSGTFTGSARRLKTYSPAMKVIEVQPESAFHGLEGMKHMPSALVPSIYDSGLADERIGIGTEEAQAMTRALVRHEGILAGPSGGAAVQAAVQVSRSLVSGVIVTVLPDGGNRYLGDSFWEAESN